MMTASQTFEMIARAREDDARWGDLRAFVVADPIEACRIASRAISSPDVRHREAAADVLGQVSTVDHDAAPAIANILRPRLLSEHDPHVLASVVFAVGHTHESAARDAVIVHARHPDENVRFAVACSLPSLGLDETVLEALRDLSTDADSDVRDWATFGLANSDSTDHETIEALAARTDDSDNDTRAEAIYGLARRKDARARSLIQRELARPVYGTLIERALEELRG